MIAPEDLIAQARQWLGVRFVHQGRTRHGADCLGFIAAVLGELGADIWLQMLPLDYGRGPQEYFSTTLEAATREVPLQPGALITFQWPTIPYASHAAIFTGESMIHSYAAVGKVVEHGYRGPWVTRTAGIWAMPLVKYQPGDVSAT